MEQPETCYVQFAPEIEGAAGQERNVEARIFAGDGPVALKPRVAAVRILPSMPIPGHD